MTIKAGPFLVLSERKKEVLLVLYQIYAYITNILCVNTFVHINVLT